jgi:hypothetical protein
MYCESANVEPSATNHSTSLKALAIQRANISGGASRSVAVRAIDAARALGPNDKILPTLGALKPSEIGLGLCLWRVCPVMPTDLSTRQIAGAIDTLVIQFFR